MDIIVSYFMPLLFILGISLFNSIIFKSKFEVVVAFSMLEGIIVTYVFGFLDLRIGLVCTVTLAVLSIPLFFYVRTRGGYSLRDKFLTDMFWVFIVLYTVVFALNLGKTFYKWDEFSHWGMMAKEMFRLDKYYYVEESVLVHHREYPPFTTIMQYIWCKLCGEYKERHLYNAKIILSLITLFPVYSWFLDFSQKGKNLIWRLGKVFGLAFLFIIVSNILTIGEAFYYRTIYTEGVLCALVFLAVFSLFAPVNNRIFSMLNISFVLTAILLTKQMGIYFYAFIVLGYFVIKIVRREKLFRVLELLAVVGVPAVMWLCWQIVTKINTPIGQFDSSKFSIENILAIFDGNAPEYRYTTIDRFLDAIINVPIISRPINISYLWFVIIFPILLIICIKVSKLKENRIRILITGCILEVTAIVYVPVMLVLYLFGFSQGEALGLACYERYMRTMLYPMMLFLFFSILSIFLREYSNHKKKIWAIGVVGLFILIPFSNLKEELIPGIFTDDVSSLFQGDSQIIVQNTSEEDSIYFICQGDNGSARNITAYLTAPRTLSTSYFNLTGTEKDEVIEYMREYDYVYVGGIDSVFVENYSELFGEDFTQENQQLYKVEVVKEQILLERVY